jgi:hypothetical protein
MNAAFLSMFPPGNNALQTSRTKDARLYARISRTGADIFASRPIEAHLFLRAASRLCFNQKHSS